MADSTDSQLLLHILASLCQLHHLPGDRRQLAQSLPAWSNRLAQLEPELTPRQWRRWRLLYTYWLNTGSDLLQHALRRGHFDQALAQELEALTPLLAPPPEPCLRSADAGACTALFISALPWGDAVGECHALALRQVRSLDRYPPLHLSARVADAAILSAGNLAIEALSQWLGRRLALERPFPLWAEAAFPDTVRLVDESASLAFVAGVMQYLFALPPALSGFSGIVRRDSGLIEPVQGFDSAYGKLEAAFDAGVLKLYLPRGTPLRALPQAGIELHKVTEVHYRYSFVDQPEDVMQIHLLADLEELFAVAFCAQAPDAVRARLESLPLQLGLKAMPALAHWQSFARRLEATLPPALLPAFIRLGRSYQQAYEFTGAGLSADWAEVSTSLRTFCLQVLGLWGAVLASLALQQGGWPMRRQLLDHLQGLRHPAPPLALIDLLTHVTGESVLSQIRPGLTGTFDTLLSFVHQLFDSPVDDLDVLWQQLRFLLTSPALPELFAAVQSADRLRVLRLRADEILDPGSELPLLQLAADGRLWFYSGMAATHETAHPIYLEPISGQTRSLPGACPYLPEPLLELHRSFSAGQLRDGRLLLGIEPLQVCVSLRNLSYLPLLALSCREQLPPGLLLKQAEAGWSGELGPLQEISFEYMVWPDQAGHYQLPSPVLDYTLPPPYAARETSPEPLLPDFWIEVESHQRPLLELKRAVPDSVLTRQIFAMTFELKNSSSLVAQALAWPELLPLGLRLVSGQQLDLPQQMPAYAHTQVSLSVEALVPGELVWPPLRLNYQDIGGESYQVELPALPLQVRFNRELPPAARRAGRAPELCWLTACLQDPSICGVLLWGERGIGKRQLLSAWQPLPFELAIEGDPFLDLPYQGARNLVRQLLTLLRQRRLPLAADAAVAQLEQFASASLGGEPEHDRQLKARSFQAVLQGLDALPEPVLLRIDRVELLDVATLELLRFLVLNQARVFLALSSSSAELPETLADLPVSVQRLERFGAAATAAVLDALFEPHRLPEWLVADLQSRTQGVLLYLQEYLAWLVQQGWIRPEQGIWTLDAERASLPVPEQLERLILREFNQVFGPADQEPSTAAAVLGPSLTGLALQALLSESVRPFLARALAAGLLRQTAADHYVFAHPLYHELFYKQAGVRLSALHERAARYFEAQAADPETIARHWLAAGQLTQALDYCLRLGEQALRQGAFAAAAQWLHQVEALDSGTAGKPARFYRLLGELNRFTDHQQKAQAAYRQCLHLAVADRSEQARAWLGLGVLAQQSEALHCLQQGHTLAQQLQDSELLRQACLQLGIHLAEARSYDEGQSWFNQALDYCEPESVARAEVLEVMGYEAIKAGQTQMAEQHLLQAKGIFDCHQQLQGLASVYNRLGACCFYQQELVRARHYFSESRKYCWQTGDQLRLAQVSHNLGLLAEALRDYPEAESLFRENLERGIRLSDVRIQGFAWNQLGSVWLKLRRLDAAREALEQAAGLLELATDQRGMAYLRLNLGLLALLEGDPELAQTQLEAARPSLEALRDIMGQDLLAMRLGHVAWLRGDLEAAAGLYGDCLTTRRVLDQKQQDGLERVHHALGLVALARADQATAEQQLKLAEVLFEQRREISHYAISCHNLMRLYQQGGNLEQALQYKQKRDVLIGIDRHGISAELINAAGLVPILD